MQSASHMFAGAHDTNASHSTFNAAGHDIYNTYVNNSVNEDQILATLKPVERPGHAHGCMEGTRKDVLEEIDRWLDDFSTSNILLLTGSPGAGKSTIAASVVSSLDERQRLGCNFAFKHDDTSLNDPSAVWPTVASDLARFHPGVKGCLVEILNGVDPGRKDITLQFRRLIEGPLTKTHNGLSLNPPVVVLDALDECGSSRVQFDQRRTLVETLTQWNKLPRVFKLIVTSRDERLPDAFRKVCQLIVLQTGSRVSTEATNDIRLFLQRRFADISAAYPSLSNWPGESRIEQLTGGAAGLFIWAETLARFVGNEQGPPDEQLDLVLRGDLGAEGDTINGLYRRILDVSFGDATARMLDAFNMIVGTIVFAKVPLRRDELVHFLSTPVKESIIDLILNKLSSVISIGTTDGVIHICHLSFSDFICDAMRSPKHFIDSGIHSQNLASTCFRLMKVGLKFNICNLETSYLRNDDVPDMADRIQRSIPTRLSYACRFGWQHLRDTPRERRAVGELLSDIDYFLHADFLHWLEVMSLIKEISAALASVQFMSGWIETSDADLAAFLADAARFVVNFSAAVSASAPHIYLSALPWSPRKSKVAQHFLPHFPHTLSIIAGQENDWPPIVNLLEGHTNCVTSVGFSPDGKRIVSGSMDNAIRIWDAETGETLAGPLEGHTDSVLSVGFSPDGKRVVSGSRDNTIRIWDAEIGEILVGPCEGHTEGVGSVGFSPDGKCVVSGSDDKTIRIWDAETGEDIVGPFEGHTGWVNSVEFSPDGKRIVSGSYDETIRIWHAETAQVIAGPFKGHREWVNSVGFSPDGKRVVSGSRDKKICVWDAETGEVIAGPFEGHTSTVTSVGFSPDGKRIVSGSRDNTIRIWDVEMGGVIAAIFEGHTSEVTSVRFSPDGKLIVSASYDEKICIWDAETAQVIAGPPKGHADRVISVTFSPDGRRVASGSDDKTICVWDAEAGEVIVGPFEGHASNVMSVAFSPDGKRVVSGSLDETICIWDAETGGVIVGPFEGHTYGVTSVRFSPDGKRVVSGSYDDTIRIWDAETGQVITGPFEGPTSSITSVEFSPDGKRVVSGSMDNTILVWDAETGQAVAGPFEGHVSTVTSVGFSPDGKRVVSGSIDNTICIWDTETGETLAGPFKGHTFSVNSVGFSPDGKHVVSGSDDKTIRIWDAETGEVIAGPFEGHTEWVNSVGFSPDGRRIVSGSRDKTVRIWHAETSEVITSPFEGCTEFQHCHLDFMTGWMKTQDGRLLFWVPLIHRSRICGTDTIVIMGGNTTRVDLGAFVHGPSWGQCREGAGKGSGRDVVVPKESEGEKEKRTTGTSTTSTSKGKAPIGGRTIRKATLNLTQKYSANTSAPGNRTGTPTGAGTIITSDEHGKPSSSLPRKHQKPASPAFAAPSPPGVNKVKGGGSLPASTLKPSLPKGAPRNPSALKADPKAVSSSISPPSSKPAGSSGTTSATPSLPTTRHTMKANEAKLGWR